MVNLLFVVAILALTGVSNCLASQTIPAEIPTAVQLSNRDINRIVCPGPMNDMIFSQEKGMTGHFSGNNGFLKFKIEDFGSEYNYAETQSELFVVCNNAVYTLLVAPANIPAVTLRLAPPNGDAIKKNIAHYQNMPLEKQALLLIKEAYDGSYPGNYRISVPNRVFSLSPDLEIKLVQEVDVDGVGLRLKKFMVKSLSDSSINLDEKLFLSSTVSKSILAVAVDIYTLMPNHSTTAYIVDQKKQIK